MQECGQKSVYCEKKLYKQIKQAKCAVGVIGGRDNQGLIT